MEKVIIDKNKVRIYFNESFYPKKFIDKAVKDFKKVCNVEIKDNFVVINSNDKNIGYEFYNYVLGLIKNE